MISYFFFFLFFVAFQREKTHVSGDCCWMGIGVDRAMFRFKAHGLTANRRKCNCMKFLKNSSSGRDRVIFPELNRFWFSNSKGDYLPLNSAKPFFGFFHFHLQFVCFYLYFIASECQVTG